MESLRAWAPRAVALIGFAVHALLAPAGLAWAGSAELIAAGMRLGSAPAPGSPLASVLVKLATLVPVGELAFRVHLLGAACSAAAMLWTARLVEGAAGSAARGEEASAPAVVGGLAAAVLLGVTLAFARQMTSASAIAPTAALLAASALLFDRVARGGDARVGLSLALVVGLGLAAHPIYRLLVPAPLLGLLWLRLHRGARWPLLAPMVALVVAGGLTLYLPVRAASGEIAAVDRGHPRDAEALVAHLAGPALGAEHEPMSDDPDVVRHRALGFAAAVVDSMGVLGLLAALAGATSLLLERRSRWLLLLLAVIAAGDAIHAAWVDPIDVADGRGGLATALAAAALAGLGVAWLGRFAGRAGPAAAAVAGAILVVGPAMTTWPVIEAGSADERARRVAEAALDVAPPGAVIVSQGEPLAGLLLHLSAAEGARPDVVVLDRPGWRDDLERTRALVGPVDESDPLLGLPARRALLWELGDGPAPRVAMGSVVGRVTPSAGAAAPGGSPPGSPAGSPAGSIDVARAAGRVAGLFAGERDPDGQRAAAAALTRLGRLAAARGDLPLALRVLDGAIAARGGHAEAWTERAAVLARLGQLDRAARSVERSLELEPHRVTALLAAARYRLALGDLAAALAHAERALRLEPDAPAAWTVAALADVRGGHTARARERLTRALTLDPDQDEARQALRALVR